jgi:hypothetical protein
MTMQTKRIINSVLTAVERGMGGVTPRTPSMSTPAERQLTTKINTPMNHGVYLYRLLISALAPLLVAGCGTARISDYQPPVPSTSERSAKESGIEVALDPFVEKARTEQYFRIDAVGNGIAILHVRVANKTADRTFFVKKEGFQLLRNSGEDLTSNGKKIERSSVAGQVMGVVGAGAVMGLVGAAMVSHATEVQRNFTSKEMGDQTLSPGENVEGFIYFVPVHRGEDWARGAAVKVKLAETQTQQLIEFNVPLSQ